jgi:uncharacterized membrane protein YebE (DUF533 family)
MSLMGTLAKVAIGVVVAKTVSGMVRGSGASTGSRGSVGSDGRFGGTHSPGRTTGLEDVMKDVFGKEANTPSTTRQSDPFGQDSGPVVANEPAGGGMGGGLGDLLKQLGGAKGGAGGAGGGLGDLLEQLGGAKAGRSGGAGGGLGDVIGQLGQGGGGGLGDLLGGILGGAAGGAMTQRGATKGFGDLLNEALGNGGEPQAAPSAQQEAAAGLMLRAMIQAAKSDGRIDENEKKKLMDNLGDATPAEQNFVRKELQAPIDIPGLCAQVPDGLGAQVYAMSVMAIDLDSQTEARYLNDLAQGLGLGRDDVNQIHAHFGVPPLYS